jgi:ABC-type nitrate/sulfonate/bicarbonate transport system substrate-binding protein
METAKAIRLVKSSAGKGLRLAGAITFPYGAVLVIRKGLNIRLDELPGKKLAAEDADCKLFQQFRRDVQRQGVDLKRISFSYVPFTDMLPALEAGVVDGMVTRGAYGVLAELQGHTILYQNWELKPGGDECCPESLAQIEYFLVVRDDALERVKPFIVSLDRASALPPSRIRRAMGERLGIAPEKLGHFPVATFAALDGKLARELGERICIPR